MVFEIRTEKFLLAPLPIADMIKFSVDFFGNTLGSKTLLQFQSSLKNTCSAQNGVLNPFRKSSSSNFNSAPSLTFRNSLSSHLIDVSSFSTNSGTSSFGLDFEASANELT